MIKISKIIYKNQEHIKVNFPYNQTIANQIKKVTDAKWSQTHIFRVLWHTEH